MNKEDREKDEKRFMLKVYGVLADKSKLKSGFTAFEESCSADVVDCARGETFEIENLIKLIKKNNDWKRMTPQRFRRALSNAYYLGRNNDKSFFDKRQSLVDLIPRVKNPGAKK